MLFSVLIANYNNTRFLETALKSVYSQTYSNWEIILVDDCSTDDFSDFIKPWLLDSRIHVYKNDINNGCGYTKRFCAQKANGELMGFLDPDDALHPNALEKMVKEHQLHQNCSLIHSTHFVCNQSLEILRIAEYVQKLPSNVPYLLINDGRIHHFASFKRGFYLLTSGISYKNKKCVDQDLYYRLEEVGDIYFLNEPLYYYRIHPGSISNFGKERETMLWHYKVIQKACNRRISFLIQNDSESKMWVRKYKTHYYKIGIFDSFRRKKWLKFAFYLIKYPFVGGAQHMLFYLKKIPSEGIGLLKKSFVTDYLIK